jgi:hypothetical protein
MYYGNVSQCLTEQINAESLLALRMYDNTKFVTPATYRSRLKVLGDPARAPRRYVLLESFGRLWEIVGLYLNPWDTFRYFRMTRHSEFAGAFSWQGIDTGHLFKSRIWRSVLVAWPHLLVLQSNARRLASCLRPSLVMVYCFEFVYGRAIIEGTRQGLPNIPIIGLQHGPISPMKLLYSGTDTERVTSTSGGPALPEPDIYSVDGAIAAGILRRRGIPAESIVINGPARFDDVWAETRLLSQTPEDATHDRTRVLVAPGLHDTHFVFGMALNALGQDSRVELVLKPHPKVSEETLSHWVGFHENGKGRGAKFTIVQDGSIYEWMARSDIFLATYSSTAVEAIALKLPIILLIPNHTPDMSLFHGQPAPVLKACNSLELQKHVERLASDPTFREEYVCQISEVLESSFGPLDSQASQRLAKLCAKVGTPEEAYQILHRLP